MIKCSLTTFPSRINRTCLEMTLKNSPTTTIESLRILDLFGSKSVNAMATCSAISNSVVYVKAELASGPLPFTSTTAKARLLDMKSTSISEHSSACFLVFSSRALALGCLGG